jgi:glycosyltransferase involved in cell wall biosynthesis
MKPDHKPLKVLLSAYACEPGKGSEPGVGWNVAKELSSKVSLWVITRANNRSSIKSSGEDWIQQVQWIYWDPPKWLTFWKKGGRGVQLFYGIWQYGVKDVAAKALATHDFDIIHHLTFGKYWIPSRLAGLPRPFVFGPVGGGECSPPGLAAYSSLRGRISELAKGLAIGLVTKLPGTKGLYRAAAWSFAATAQTEQALRQLGVSRVSILPQSGIRPTDLPRIDTPSEQRDSDELLLVTAARLIHWKAIDLAIEAVAVARRTIQVRLIVLQTGPEMENLKALARRLGVEEQIEFKGRLPRLEDVYHEIARADALVHPALHEAFGQACLEALALGVPVICLNWGGPGLIVDTETGFAIGPGDRVETISRLAQAMVNLAAEREQGISRAASCKERAYGGFHWEKLADAIVGKYEEASCPQNQRHH